MPQYSSVWGVDERIAVAFRGRGDKKRRALGLGEAERIVGAERADLERLDGQLQIIDGAGGRREVEDDVHLAGDVEVLGDVLLDEAVVRITLQVVEVGRVAGDEVVHADDAESFRQKTVGEMAAQESGSAGDDCGFHKRDVQS